MKTIKPVARHRFLVAALLASLLIITGCVGTRIGVSWAALSLVGDENYIFVAYNDFLVVVDPANGRPVQLRNAEGQVRTDDSGNPRRWEIRGNETSSEFFSTPLKLEDEKLLVADYNNRLFRVDYRNARIENPGGVELPGHVIADLVRWNNTAVIGMSEGNVAGYDLDTMEQRWLVETDRGVWAEPAVVEGIAYVPSIDQHLYAIDIETGENVWTLNLEGAMAASPVYGGDGSLFIGTIGRRVFEVSLDGEILTEYQTEDWVWGKPVIVDDILYVADLSGHVYALDTTDNLAEVWKVRASESGIRARPLVTENTVIVASRGGNVYWLERANGQQMFAQEVGAEILSDLLLVEPTPGLSITEPLVVISTVRGDRTLVAFTLEGAPRWTYER